MKYTNKCKLVKILWTEFSVFTIVHPESWNQFDIWCKCILQHTITFYRYLQGGLKQMLPIASVQPWWVWPPLIATLRTCPFPLALLEVPLVTSSNSYTAISCSTIAISSTRCSISNTTVYCYTTVSSILASYTVPSISNRTRSYCRTSRAPISTTKCVVEIAISSIPSISCGSSQTFATAAAITTFNNQGQCVIPCQSKN